MAHLQIIRSSYGWDEVSLRVFPTSLLASASKTQKSLFQISGCSQKSPVWMDVQEEVLFDAQKEVCSKKEDFHKEFWFRYSKRSPAWMFKKRSIQKFFSSSGWTQDERTPHVYRWPFFSLCPLTTTNPPLGSSLSWGGCITISYIYHQIPLIPFAPGSAIILYEA